MGRRRAKKKPKTGAAVAADCITALPLDLRARIVSFLPYWQAIQLSALSQSWRHLHHHAPVVDLDLREFVFDEDHPLHGLLDADALVGVRVALVRRAQEGGAGCKVETFRLSYSAGDPSVKRHADRLIALADAPKIRLYVPYGGGGRRVPNSQVADTGAAWTVDLPPAARYLELRSRDYLTPTIAGPGAAALRELHLDFMTLGEWPRLPSLRSLTLSSVTATAPFAPGASCPLLEHLTLWDTKIEHARVDICLPLLKSLDMDEVDINPPGHIHGPFAVVTVDAPELRELIVNCTSGWCVECKSFALRTPRLRYLSWFGLFVERVSVDVGRPGSVINGKIEFTSNGDGEDMSCREMKYYRAQMTRMLEGLLPDVPPERVADVARSDTPPFLLSFSEIDSTLALCSL